MADSRLVKLCVDTYRGNVEKYSTDEGKDVVRKAFIDIIGTDKINRKVFRRHKTEIFEILEETLEQLIVDGWAENTFFDQFVEVKDASLGDKNEFYVPDRTLLVASKFSGGHWNMRRQRLNKGESFSIKTDWYGVKIYENFALFIAGRIDWNKMVSKVAEAMTNLIKDQVYTSFMGASTYLPSEFKGSGSMVKDTFIEKCEHVKASIGNKPVIIAGTKTALGALEGTINDAWVSDEAKRERDVNGLIRTWEGYTLMEIEQSHKANSYEFQIDPKKILILPADVKPVKLFNEGESMILDKSNGTENMDMSLEYMFQQKMGVEVIFNVLYGEWALA